MPLSYTWALAVPSGAPAGAPAAAVVPYARRLDPVTGDVVFDPARSSWATGSPLAEVALRLLRTPRGSAARDPSYGVDWARLENARDDAGATAVQVIERAFDRWVRRREVRDLRVAAEVRGQALFLRVEFRDGAGAAVALVGSPA